MQIVVNAAMSADGKLSTARRDRVVISGPVDFDRVDRLRADCDAIMVGIGTVLADDPRLLIDDGDRRADRVRGGRPPNPLRIVADSTARTPPDARILSDDAATVVVVSRGAPRDRVERLGATGASVIEAGNKRVDVAQAVEELGAMDIERMLVEGGGELLFSLFESGLVDEMISYVGACVIGGRDAPTLVDGVGFQDADAFPKLRLESVEEIDTGVLIKWHIDE